MLSENVFIFLIALCISQAVPSVVGNTETNNSSEQSTNESVNWKLKVDRQIEALETINDQLKNELRKIKITIQNAPVDMTNPSNVTAKVNSNDTRYTTATVQENTTTEQAISSALGSEEPYCYLNIDDKSRLQPLVLTSTLAWPTYERNGSGSRFIRINKGDNLIFVCPKEFMNFDENHVTAACDRGTTLTINGVSYEYSDIKCTEEFTHFVERTKQNCHGAGLTEVLNIVYKLFNSKTILLYEICIVRNILIAVDYIYPLYTKHYINYRIDVQSYEESQQTWLDSNEFANIDFDETYNCTSQTQCMSAVYGRDFHTEDKCCYAKRQLVSYKDLYPGVPQRAAFSYLNLGQQWSTCNSQNWDEVERRVRILANSIPNQLIVWSGLGYGRGDINSCGIKVLPEYFWKVVQDPVSERSLAIIQLNIPDVSPSIVDMYAVCTDICNSTGWMRNPNWSNLSMGYTFCCNIDEFVSAFQYGGRFKPWCHKVLSTTNIDLLSH